MSEGIFPYGAAPDLKNQFRFWLKYSKLSFSDLSFLRIWKSCDKMYIIFLKTWANLKVFFSMDLTNEQHWLII